MADIEEDKDLETLQMSISRKKTNVNKEIKGSFLTYYFSLIRKKNAFDQGDLKNNCVN